MTMLHDVLRFMVRQGPRTPVNIHRALQMIDGDEAGFQTVEEYEGHLGRPLPRGPEDIPAAERIHTLPKSLLHGDDADHP